MGRYEDVGNDVYKMLEEVIATEQSHVDGANFCIMFDTKKKKSGDNYILGRIKATSEELKAFAIDDNGVVYDYIIYLDKEVWLRIDEEDQKRLLYHELCHCKVAEDTENQYKTKPHEIETFYSEIERNASNPRWAERLAAIAAAVYDSENNQMPE